MSAKFPGKSKMKKMESHVVIFDYPPGIPPHSIWPIKYHETGSWIDGELGLERAQPPLGQNQFCGHGIRPSGNYFPPSNKKIRKSLWSAWTWTPCCPKKERVNRTTQFITHCEPWTKGKIPIPFAAKPETVNLKLVTPHAPPSTPTHSSSPAHVPEYHGAR